MWPVPQVAHDAISQTLPRQRLGLETLEDRTTPSVLGVGLSTPTITAAANGVVQSFTTVGTASAAPFVPYAGYAGEVAIAQGDVNNDLTLDLITGTGVGTTHIKVFSGTTGAELYSFLAFDGFPGGVSVGSGDINNDNFADIIVGAGPGALGGHVKVYSGLDGSLLRSFFSFPAIPGLTFGFGGGVNVAGGDVNNDRFDDIIVASGPGAPGGHVKVYSGADNTLFRSFLTFAGFSGGVNVATGDVNGDSFSDIIVGAGLGAGGGAVKVFNGADPRQIASFFSYDTSYLGGVRVASQDIDGDNLDDILTATALGASHIKAFQSGSLGLLANFIAFNNFPGGVRI